MTIKRQGRRSAQDAQKTKKVILQVATELFCSLGYERVSLRHISDKAGVSHSLIRYHFGSKEQIWYAISDGLHRYMGDYIRTIISHIPQQASSGIKLYSFCVHLLAHMLVVRQPIQFIADAVRQDDALFDYFIDNSGQTEQQIDELITCYNEQNPDAQVKIAEIKWQMLMYAHGAASLTPFMMQTWADETNNYEQSLLHHWQMYNALMARTFNIPEDLTLQPEKVSDLVHQIECNL